MATFGKTAQGATDTPLRGERAFNNAATGARNMTLCKFTLAENALVSDISMMVSRDDTAWPFDVRYVIYADNAGSPGALKAATPIANLTFNQPKRSGTPSFALVTIALSSPVALPAGTYWIGYMMDRSDGQGYAWFDATGNMYEVVDSWGDGPSDPVNGGGVTSAKTISIYATYIPATVGVSLATPYAMRARAGKSLAQPYGMTGRATKSLAQPWKVKVTLGKSLSLLYAKLPIVGKSLALVSKTKVIVGRTTLLRYGVALAPSIPGKSNSDSYADGPSTPFGGATVEATDLSIFATFVSTPWYPPEGLDEMQYARLPFSKAQDVFELSEITKGTRRVKIGWHGTKFDPERGSFGIVASTGLLADLVGERLRITFADLPKPHTIFVYVHAEDDLVDGADLSLPRRAYMALNIPTKTVLSANVEVAG